MVQTKARLARGHGRRVLRGAMGFSRRRVLVTSADEVWVIRKPSAIDTWARQEGEFGREEGRVDLIAARVE